MTKLTEMLTERQKADAKSQSTLNNKKDTLKAEQKKLNQLKKQHSNVSQSSTDFNINHILKVWFALYVLWNLCVKTTVMRDHLS